MGQLPIITKLFTLDCTYLNCNWSKFLLVLSFFLLLNNQIKCMSFQAKHPVINNKLVAGLENYANYTCTMPIYNHPIECSLLGIFMTKNPEANKAK